MQPIRRISIIEQTASKLREGLLSGRWGHKLPGVLRLAAECDVSKDAVRAALRQLEAEGLLAPQGHGRCRTVLDAGASVGPPRKLRVTVLLHDRLVDENAGMQRLLFQLQHDLEAAGHVCVFSTKCQEGLRHSVPRILRHVAEISTDAWIVVDGSLELLQWFAAQPVPAMAIGGRADGLPLAATITDVVAADHEAVRHLIALGHRRIVFIFPRHWRKPTPGQTIQAFIAELAAHGIKATDYHLPDWEETPKGLRSLLTELFRVTAPTAIIVSETTHVVAVLAFLAERGLRLPAQVSLVCMSIDSTLAWCHPPLAHFSFDHEPLVRRIVRWVAAVAKGRADRKRIGFPAEFVPGSTIAPPPKNQR